MTHSTNSVANELRPRDQSTHLSRRPMSKSANNARKHTMLACPKTPTAQNASWAYVRKQMTLENILCSHDRKRQHLKTQVGCMSDSKNDARKHTLLACSKTLTAGNKCNLGVCPKTKMTPVNTLCSHFRKRPQPKTQLHRTSENTNGRKPNMLVCPKTITAPEYASSGSPNGLSPKSFSAVAKRRFVLSTKRNKRPRKTISDLRRSDVRCVAPNTKLAVEIDFYHVKNSVKTEH